MEGGEGETQLIHIEDFTNKNKEDVDYIAGLLKEKKAVYLQGSTQMGKTSLAVAAMQKLAREATEEEPVTTFYTTPSVQESVAAMPTRDRTGVMFKKLPSVDAIEATKGNVVILIDEVSARAPDPMQVARWKEYIKAPNTHFVLIGQPKFAATRAWTDLFPQDSLDSIEFDETHKQAA